MSALDEKLEALAASLLKACDGEVSLDAKVDIFKAVASYRIACNRPGRGKKPEGTTFNDIVSRLNNHDGGTA
jgi:hypothetical protein